LFLHVGTFEKFLSVWFARFLRDSVRDGEAKRLPIDARTDIHLEIVILIGDAEKCIQKRQGRSPLAATHMLRSWSSPSLGHTVPQTASSMAIQSRSSRLSPVLTATEEGTHGCDVDAKGKTSGLTWGGV